MSMSKPGFAGLREFFRGLEELFRLLAYSSRGC